MVRVNSSGNQESGKRGHQGNLISALGDMISSRQIHHEITPDLPRDHSRSRSHMRSTRIIARRTHSPHPHTVSALRNTAASHRGGRCRVSPLPPLPRPPLRPPPLRPPLLPRLLVPLPLAPTLRRRRSSRRTPQRHRDAPGDKTAPSTSARQALTRAAARRGASASRRRAHAHILRRSRCSCGGQTACAQHNPSDGLCTAQPV